MTTMAVPTMTTGQFFNTLFQLAWPALLFGVVLIVIALGLGRWR